MYDYDSTFVFKIVFYELLLYFIKYSCYLMIKQHNL